MKWVNASEKKPNEGGLYFFKNDNGERGTTIYDPWDEHNDGLDDNDLWLDESQLSEGGEESQYSANNLAIRAAKAETELDALKQHNLKLTECLGELVKCSETIKEYFDPKNFSIYYATIDNAKELLNLKK